MQSIGWGIKTLNAYSPTCAALNLIFCPIYSKLHENWIKLSQDHLQLFSRCWLVKIYLVSPRIKICTWTGLHDGIWSINSILWNTYLIITWGMFCFQFKKVGITKLRRLHDQSFSTGIDLSSTSNHSALQVDE